MRGDTGVTGSALVGAQENHVLRSCPEGKCPFKVTLGLGGTRTWLSGLPGPGLSAHRPERTEAAMEPGTWKMVRGGRVCAGPGT